MVDDGLLGNSLQSSTCAVVVSVGRLGVAGVAVDVEDGLAFIGADDVDEAVLKGSDDFGGVVLVPLAYHDCQGYRSVPYR